MALPYVSSRVGRFQWLAQRVSAILLLFLAFSHFAIQHFSAEAVSTGLTVAARMNDPLWQSYYVIFVVLVLYHGINGLIGICYDYAPKPLTRGIISLVLWSLGGFFAILGLVNVVDATSVEDTKVFYATNGFGAGTTTGKGPIPIEYDLRQEASEMAMLSFYLDHHVNRTDADAKSKAADLFTGDATAKGKAFDDWALKQLHSPPAPQPASTIFANSSEFALWALNVRRANARHRQDSSVGDRLTTVPVYTNSETGGVVPAHPAPTDGAR